MTLDVRDEPLLNDRPEHPEEACGVFAVYAPGEDVARLTYFGLHALQHRGQESAGIAVGDNDTVTVTKNLGLVSRVFKESDLDSLTGDVAIGHTRYSTTGSSTSWENAQPHLSTIGHQVIALAHNGNLVNTHELRDGLKDKGLRFRSTTDSEVIATLIGYFTQQTHHIRAGIRETMKLINGAYAVVLTTENARLRLPRPARRSPARPRRAARLGRLGRRQRDVRARHRRRRRSCATSRPAR